MIVLDTNVVSELMRASPAENVFDWVAGQPAQSLYITSISLAEIVHGILLFSVEFGGRILPFEASAARAYAKIAVDRRHAGRPISSFDAQIAAIALVARATLATRNVSDFEGCGLKLMNPWSK